MQLLLKRMQDMEKSESRNTRARASVGRLTCLRRIVRRVRLETDLDPYNEDDEFVDADAAQPWTFARAIAGKAKIEDFHPIETPEMADLAKMLTGQMPRIREQLRAAHGQALGMFRVRGEKGSIELRADIFLGPEVANQVSKPLGKEARKLRLKSSDRRLLLSQVLTQTIWLYVGSLTVESVTWCSGPISRTVLLPPVF